MTRTRVDPTRRVALDVLQAVRTRDAYANLVLPSLLTSRRVTGRDANFATELTYGTLRGQGTYDVIIGHCVDRPGTRLDAIVHDILRLGAHQLLRMNVPNHAAVGTSVELAKSAGRSGLSGLVNAVMRRLGEQSLDAWLEQVIPNGAAQAVELSIRYSHPEWIVTGFQDVLSDWSETQALLVANNTAATVTLVARPGRCTVDELVAGGARADTWSPVGASWPGGEPSALPAVQQGRAGVQDAGSQLVALALANAELDGKDTAWLDLCAGPGGKAALLGGLAGQRGAALTAVEPQPHRATLISQAVDNDVDVVVADGRDQTWATGTYDRVLVDVPCSGLGALRRRPEARWRRSASDVEQLQLLQRQLLTNAVAAIRPGGVVAYVTCSPLRSETSDVVSTVLGADSGLSQRDARPLLPGVSHLGPGPDVQLWPHRHNTDAMYLAILERN
ncbi:MAG TPA: transcription antitermination factor NusB [Actinomycetes bacterium]|nr:transcription antitermination factor NusB [Actinomycetes bacterium]